MLKHNIQVIIFAAGYGTRMAPLTTITPKPLVKINNECLIIRLIKQLRQANIIDVVINVCHLKDQIISTLGNGNQFGVNIKYSVETPRPKETAGAVRYAIEQQLLDTDRAVLTVSSDIYTNFHFKTLININPTIAHLFMVQNPQHNQCGDFGCIDNFITLNAPHYTYSGIGIFNPKLFIQYPQHERIGSLIKMLLDTANLSGEIFNGIWHDVGTVGILQQLQLKYSKQYNIA